MPSGGYSRSPKFQRGALVQLPTSLTFPIPVIIPFQYNPATLRRSIVPYAPPQPDNSGRSLAAPGSQPADPEQEISMEVELDASDELDHDEVLAGQFGVAHRIAAIESLLFVGENPLSALLSLIPGLPTGAMRSSVPIVFFVWGVGRILPVRITRYSIEEQLFLTSLFPSQAKIQLSMQVLTAAMFAQKDDIVSSLAKGAYNLHRVEQQVLTTLNTANAIASGISLKI
jgi:hypothetical protein